MGRVRYRGLAALLLLLVGAGTLLVAVGLPTSGTTVAAGDALTVNTEKMQPVGPYTDNTTPDGYPLPPPTQPVTHDPGSAPAPLDPADGKYVTVNDLKASFASGRGTLIPQEFVSHLGEPKVEIIQKPTEDNGNSIVDIWLYGNPYSGPFDDFSATHENLYTITGLTRAQITLNANGDVVAASVADASNANAPSTTSDTTATSDVTP